MRSWWPTPAGCGLIHANSRKADEADAEHLARLAQLDPQLLSPIRHRGLEAQAHTSGLVRATCLTSAQTSFLIPSASRLHVSFTAPRPRMGTGP